MRAEVVTVTVCQKSDWLAIEVLTVLDVSTSNLPLVTKVDANELALSKHIGRHSKDSAWLRVDLPSGSMQRENLKKSF